MPNANLQFFLNSYNDLAPTTTPSRNNFKWLREINGLPLDTAFSQEIQLLPSATSPNIIPYPFSSPTHSGSATINATTTLVVSGSTTGIAAGQSIVGTGIPVGTTVVSISGSTVIMSQAASTSGSPSVSFYAPASFIYIESDQLVSVIYNNGSAMILEPFQINGLTQPAVFFMAGPVYSLTVTSLSATTAKLYFASMG
jgi:hypothetical protein